MKSSGAEMSEQRAVARCIWCAPGEWDKHLLNIKGSDHHMAKADLIEPAGSAGAIHRAPAVARAATVLRLLAGERSGLGVTEIARRVGLVPSTCLHVLRALVEEGFIVFDDTKKTYRTGVGLMTLVREAMASSDFPKVVQPTLDELANEHRVTAVAVELDSRERMVVVALARSASFISLHVNVGSRFPSFISATGRCVAAASNLSREELKSRFDALQWEKAPRFEDWYADVERARIEGAAIDRSSYIRGLTIVATLLPLGTDRQTRGIALIGFEHNMTDRTTRQLKEDLLDAAKKVAARLN
uniref:Transcriptional regulator, IclR family n=1 Tax=Sphingomonas sp. JE1 TaxID=1628059 RepID=A0A0D5A067_9SPHN|nr:MULTISPECIES: IclR family transcriptional regulator [unclassified Sphingomonas]AJW29556.1 Transcriptional regulator, IclR family [Sphingomonas sp. JE1]